VSDKTNMLIGIHRELEQESDVSTSQNRGQYCGWLAALRNLSSIPGSGTLTGAILSVLAALVTGAIASGHTWGVEVPLLFTVVLLVVALLFGAWAGVLGTLLSGLVFATHLFAPLGNLRVASDAARSNLGWMLMIGIAFSFLFAPQKSALRRE
jgi:K+-sensing histidine kinase KdpD